MGEHYACQGNILVSEDTMKAMAQGFEDPAAFEGSEEERREKFAEVCNQIDDRIKQRLAEVGR